jgi:hypothetical protein
MEEGRGGAALLGGLEDVVRYVEVVVEEDGKDAEVHVWDVEGGRGEEDFSGDGVRECVKGLFM